MAAKKKKPETNPADVAHDARDPAIEREVEVLAADSAPVRYARQEVRQQEEDVEQLLKNGSPPSQMCRILRERWPRMSKSRVYMLVARVKDRWREESAKTREMDREAAIRRIHTYRMHAAGEFDARTGKWIRQPNHQALAKWERLLMDLQGTREAIKIDVGVVYTQAMLQVVARLDGEQASDLLEEAREQERLAEAARTLLPALTSGG